MMMLRTLALAVPLALGCAAARPNTTAPTPDVACASISESERTAFARADEVTPLLGNWRTENRRWSFTRVVGAELRVKAEPGTSLERMHRVAACRTANLASAKVRVLSAGNAYAVQITSDDPAVASEIVERAKARTL